MTVRRTREPRSLRPLAGVAITAVLLGLAAVSGGLQASSDTLQVMGFDPDRALMITALVMAAVSAALLVLLLDRRSLAVALGGLVVAVLFGGTFLAETQSAMASTGTAGSFDSAGWLITVLTLVVAAVVSAWAGATLAAAVRPALAQALGALAAVARRRRLPGPAARQALGVLLVVVIMAITLPVFSDLVNYTPDARMLHGGPQLVGLTGPDQGGGGSPTPTPDSGQTPASTASGASPSAVPSPTPSSSPVPHIWTAWTPTGTGAVAKYSLPAPWKGGSALAEVDVYTPPGYAHSTRRYPVLYQAPYPFSHWDSATNVFVALNTLIDRGTIPPMIVVSMNTAGDPYPDSECANSFDGREWFDTYTAQTVVPWVDGHFRTLADRGARAIMGASIGGYCAAILALHHPDVFGSSLAFSGYFHAAADGGGSWAPFGRNQDALNQASPDYVAPRLDPKLRATLFFVLVYQPDQPLYGPQAVSFDQVLTANGYPHSLVQSTLPHGWGQVRLEFAKVMTLWCERMVSTGALSR